MDDNILVIGIAGGTGSGKTTLMNNLISRFEGMVTVISHDNYYKRHDDMTYEERSQLNYDEPAAFDTNLMDIRIFVDTDADIRLCRRIKRDVNKRGRTLESVLKQYQDTVKPMHERYVEPSKKYANIVVPEGGKNLVALDMIVGRIQRHLEET